MPDKNNTGNERSEPKVNRRNILQVVGVSALGTTGFGGIASADSTQSPPEISIEQLTGVEENKAIKHAKSTSDFSILEETISSEYNLSLDRSNNQSEKLIVNRGGKEIEKYELVTFFTEDYSLAKENGGPRAEITICLQDGELYRSNAVVFNTINSQIAASDRELVEVIKLSVEGNQVRTESQIVDSELESTIVGPTPADINKCSACKEIFRFVCDNGCGLSTTAICLAAGIVTSPFGSAACSAIALVVCDNIDLSEDCDASALIFCRDQGYC